MNSSTDSMPIIIGVGQFTQQVPDNLTEAMSHTDICAAAASRAMDDAGTPSLSQHIDTVACVRTFADSVEEYSCPFGGSNNLPRSVAKRIGANPRQAIYPPLGGNTPQELVGEFFEKLHQGETECVLLVGGEVIANIRAALKADIQLDWHEQVDGSLDDKGPHGTTPLVTRSELIHKIHMPTPLYALMENARRKRLGMSLDDYIQLMGELYEPFNDIAVHNPYSMFTESMDAKAITTVTESNNMHALPYMRSVIAKDGVNQGAALLLTTVGKAKSLGIDENKWVYLHGYSATSERVLLERPNLDKSQAMEQALKGALQFAAISASDINYLELYSCFPVVVFNACDVLGIEKEDKRALTQTGGLAFFGGPGNNYTMHGIASLVETLRDNPQTYGLVWGNGGVMSKHAVGIYSTVPPAKLWQPCDSAHLQQCVDDEPAFPIEHNPEGRAIIETYTVLYRSGKPEQAVIIGQLDKDKKRFYAVTEPGDETTLLSVLETDPLDINISVSATSNGNTFRLV